MTCIKMENTNLLNTSMLNGSRPCIPTPLNLVSSPCQGAFSVLEGTWRFSTMLAKHVGYMRISQYPGTVGWFKQLVLSSSPAPMVPHGPPWSPMVPHSPPPWRFEHWNSLPTTAAAHVPGWIASRPSGRNPTSNFCSPQKYGRPKSWPL